MTAALVFSVGDLLLGVPSYAVHEVVRPVWPTPVPRAPAGCLGVIDLRGQLVPLVRLGVLLSVEPLRRPPDLAAWLASRSFLVLSLPALVAAVVDRVHDVGEFRPGGHEGGVGGAAVLGTCAVGERTALVLDPARLVAPARARLLQRALAAAGRG